MADSLADDASNLIKACMEYREIGPVTWDATLGKHTVLIPSIKVTVWLSSLDEYLLRTREDLIMANMKHILQEVSQPGFGNLHGSRAAYNRGCRGLLCRRANREDLRALQKQKPSERYAIPDELLAIAESRILPEVIVGHVRFADRVARVS